MDTKRYKYFKGVGIKWVTLYLHLTTIYLKKGINAAYITYITLYLTLDTDLTRMFENRLSFELLDPTVNNFPDIKNQ